MSQLKLRLNMIFNRQFENDLIQQQHSCSLSLSSSSRSSSHVEMADGRPPSDGASKNDHNKCINPRLKRRERERRQPRTTVRR